HLTLFREAVDGLSSPRLQEIYTGTFDLDARCHPYIGYQLLGESYKRSQFMLGLKECYREHGVQPPSNELPDHLAVMLRFLAAVPNREISREMVVEALMPALEGMLREAQQEEPPEEAKDAGKSLAKPSPYEMVLRALLGWLRRTYGRAYFEGESRE
nr:nitrate reductase molybdenum cofactor assembly chaperone [Anaerolineae bacterium]